MDARFFFETWETSHRLTRQTLDAFPEGTLGQEVIPGLRTPGELFGHIVAHTRAAFDACLKRQVNSHESYDPPGSLDCTSKPDLLLYSRQVMEMAFAHANQAPEVWKQKIATPWGRESMEKTCVEAYSHEIHHRGQLYVMLRKLGITPPPFCSHERL
jgi:uncharacterized damage-inducible protein DinB